MDVPTELLRCPVTGGGVGMADDEQLASVNARIAAGGVRTREGVPVTDPLPAALVSEDGRCLHRVADGIIELLAERAIEADGVVPPGSGLRSEKRSVQAFYDEVGWKKERRPPSRTPRASSTPATSSSAISPLGGSASGATCRAEGTYLLDVASGPVQFPEYRAYQEGFEHRICVDFSRLALQEARANVGENGILVQGDITRLPFADGTIDAAVSLHTIYHVPRDEQARAFLRSSIASSSPVGYAVVAYSWGHTHWGELSRAAQAAAPPRPRRRQGLRGR